MARAYEPRLVTSAGTAALLTSVEVQNFVYFTSQTAYGYATKVEGKMPHASGSPDAIGVLRAFAQTLFEMVLGRSVDNFLVAQLLALVFPNPHESRQGVTRILAPFYP